LAVRSGGAPGKARTGILLLVLLLTACASPQVRRLDLASQAQSEREQLLAGSGDWGLQGRVAVRSGGEQGSGSVDWEVSSGKTRFTLQAPISRRSWRLSMAPGSAVLEGLDQGRLEAPDAGTLLRESVGWELPIEQLAYWIRGARAPGPARISFNADGLPSRIEQAGWVIEYPEWRGTREGHDVPMPRRVFAQRPQASVRMVVDQWR
jgi:outer membrane lipoprotein LolB